MSDFDLLPDGVVVLDGDGRIAVANRAFAALVGTDASGLVGRPIGALAPRDAVSGAPVAWQGTDVDAGERAVSLRRDDGTDVVASVTAASSDGRVALVLRPCERAPRDSSAIEIVSTVSHELRSPLTSVKGYTSLLLNKWDRLPDDQKKLMLEQVNHDADRVTRLITELLDISRLETGRLQLRRQMVDVAALAARVVEKVGMEYDELDATLRFDDGLPQVYADADKVEQVLTNLIENACKYATPVGLVVEGAVDGGHVAVSVADRGQGIPTGDLPRVFDKFFRRAEGKPTGSGLGLWISRGLVEAHGGQLSASSQEGVGTTFRFTLPLDAFEELHGS